MKIIFENFSKLVLKYLLFPLVIMYLPFLHSKDIEIGTNHKTYTFFQKWTKNQSCSDISISGKKGVNRNTVELILLCKALKIGGLNERIKVVETPNYTRSLFLAKAGSITMPSETVWITDIDKSSFYVSDPVVRKGEYEVGVYTRKDRLDMHKIRSLDELKKFSAVSSILWIHDWAALTKIGVEKHSVYNLLSMYKMVDKGRADFTLQDFQLNNIITLDGVSLFQISNIKFVFAESRHFVVSKAQPHSKIVFLALQQGLKKLRKQGSITKAYVESGFFNVKRDTWKNLNVN